MEEREVGAVVGVDDAWRLNACADDIATTSRTAARRDGEEDRCRPEQNGEVMILFRSEELCVQLVPTFGKFRAVLVPV